jgi:hypothetical protein
LENFGPAPNRAGGALHLDRDPAGGSPLQHGDAQLPVVL